MISVSTFGLCKPPHTKNKALIRIYYVCTHYTIYGNIWNINIGLTPMYCFFFMGPFYHLYQSSSSTAKASTQTRASNWVIRVSTPLDKKNLKTDSRLFLVGRLPAVSRTPRNTSNRSSNKWNIHVSSCISRV